MKVNEMIFPYESESESTITFELVKRIYDSILDEESKKIFKSRILLSCTQDVSCLKELILSTKYGKKFRSFLEKHQNGIYVYGAGIRGKRLVNIFSNINWKAYIDTYKKGKCNGLPICSLNQLELKSEEVILITNYSGATEIKAQIIEYGIPEEQIYTIEEFEHEARKDIYFEERCVRNFRQSSDLFVDAGCYDGEDCLKFIKSDLYSNNKLIAFEPDFKNMDKCRKRLEEYKQIDLFELALSDKKEKIIFSSDEGEWARVDENGNCVIEAESLDNLIQEKIGYIKMDIEGSESKALLGAKRHIKQEKPNLAISIYHKLEDIVNIPLLLLEIEPNYRFALGHYFVSGAADTVLYAFVADDRK